MTIKARLLAGVMPILLCFFLSGCGPFVVTETEYDAYGEVGSETVEYNDGGAPRVLEESGAVPDSAIGDFDSPDEAIDSSEPE
jgi:hypothetical protein